jgi:type I restriction enzyme S subunit
MNNPSWNWRPLGELFSIGAGKTMSEAARAGANKVPFLRTSNVFWDEIDLTQLDEMSMSPDELAAKSLLPGDLLICEGGDIGRAAVWSGEREVMSFQNHLHRLRPLIPDIEPRFYVYFLQSAFTQLGIFEGAGNKTTIPNLSRNRLAALEVPVPPVAEQRAVVRALAYAREAMKAHDLSLNRSQELKRAAMRELFMRGLRGEPRKDSEIGAIPNSWKPTPIGDVTLNAQYGLSVRGHVTGRYPILRMNCQEDGQVVFRNLQYVDLDAKDFEAFKLASGDLLFNRTNSIEHVGRTAIFTGGRDAVFASYLVRLTVDPERCRPSYLNYYMNMPSTQADIKKLASRAVGQANINATKLRTVVFPLPSSVEEQDEIVSVLDAIDRKIDLHRQKGAVLEDLFKSLLYKLMTGEIRASDLELSAIQQSEAVAA